MQSIQEAKDENTSKTTNALFSDGQVENFKDLLKQKVEEIDKNFNNIDNLYDKIKSIESRAKLFENINDTDFKEMSALESEYNKYKQDFNNLYNQNDNKDGKKSFKTIEAELDKWKETLSDKIKTEMDSIWDDEKKEFKKETSWWLTSWFTKKPTKGELEGQKNALLGKSIVVKNCGVSEINQVKAFCNDIKERQNEFEASLSFLKRLHEEQQKHDKEEKKKLEHERQKLEEEKKKLEHDRQKQEEEKKTISPYEINKIIQWLKTEQHADKPIFEKDVINKCREFGVNNFNDFKTALLQDIDLERMQEFVKDKLNIVPSKEECVAILRNHKVKTFAELFEKLNQGAEEIVETIGGERANEIRDKLHNEARNISDYVDCMNDLANNQDKPLIKKVDVNLLQAKADSLKKTLGEKNIFIQFLMLFGYDPDGLVTAYHIAKDRLKEAKWNERSNLLNNSGNNFINNNSEYSKMYSGNKNVANNNNIALFGQQSLQQSNTYLGY